jgi:hypothetical protein
MNVTAPKVKIILPYVRHEEASYPIPGISTTIPPTKGRGRSLRDAVRKNLLLENQIG